MNRSLGHAVHLLPGNIVYVGLQVFGVEINKNYLIKYVFGVLFLILLRLVIDKMRHG